MVFHEFIYFLKTFTGQLKKEKNISKILVSGIFQLFFFVPPFYTAVSLCDQENAKGGRQNACFTSSLPENNNDNRLLY